MQIRSAVRTWKKEHRLLFQPYAKAYGGSWVLYEAVIRDTLFMCHTWYVEWRIANANFDTQRIPKHRAAVRQSANTAIVRLVYRRKN